MKIYLAGPMTGYPEFNFPLFMEVASFLTLEGDHVISNPALHDLRTTPSIEYEPGFATGDPSKTRLFDSRVAFMWDFTEIINGHAIALLPGWESSVGARMERLVAEKTGKLVFLVVKEGWGGWKLVPDPIQVRMNAVVER